MKEVVRFNVNLIPAIGERAPLVWFVEYPPLEGETSDQYHRRVYPLIMAEDFARKPSLWQRAKHFLRMN